MKRNINIQENIAHRDPFKAPEGYFESLTDSVMQRIEQAETKTKAQRRIVRLWRLSAAACVAAVLAFGAWRFIPSTTPPAEESDTQLFANTPTDDDWEAVMDYTMIDNEEIAYYMTEMI